MPPNSANLEQLFERTWRPGHPFRPRLGRLRRYGMLLFLLFLSTIIVGYWYLTDSQRMRVMCETYLSQLVGGRVTVKHATLSIFEGLRLDGVKVLVDENGGRDSEVFDAQTLLIKYNPASILSGQLEATQIVAIDPRIRLCEDETHHWNYQRMALPHPPVGRPGHAMKLPQISLRNGRVDYSKIEDGNITTEGSMAFDGGLTPGEAPATYGFNLQSRGGSDLLGPQIVGTVVTTTGEVSGKFGNFEFGHDIKAMLPEQVRQWWEDHELAGRIDIPSYHFKPAQPALGLPASFVVEMTMSRVNLAVRPQEWMSRDETQRAQTMLGALDLLHLAAFDPPTPQRVPSDGFPGGIDQHTFADRIRTLIEPTPLRLESVEGRYVFNQDGIQIDHVSGYLEHNPFSIDGNIRGYSLDAEADINVEAENLFLPHSPHYVNSMPRPVHEFYEHLHPEGTCTLHAHVARPKGGVRPVVSGELDVIDGQFVFDRFAYPLRRASGRILWGPDPQHPEAGDRCEVRNLTGLGIEGGPNTNTAITINGTFQPLTREVGCSLKVQATNVTSEPALRAAFPRDVDEALRIFDAEGKGEFPKFHGSFVCNVTREVGVGNPWRAAIDLDLDDASGCFVPFPYPLDHVQAKIAIRDGHVDILSATAHRGDTSVAIDGSVKFGKNQPIDPDLTLKARNVKVDEMLLAALPAERSAWLKTIGLGGVLDIDGKIFLAPHHGAAPADGNALLAHEPPQRESDLTIGPAGEGAAPRPSESPVEFDMHVALRDGVICPAGGKFSVSNIAGQVDLTSKGLVLTDFTGKRGQATLSGDGVVNWQAAQPQLTLNILAKNLLLDAPLYALLPAKAQAGWDQVQPQGTLDAELHYNFVPAKPDAGAVGSGTAAAAGSNPAVAATPPPTAAAPGVVPAPSAIPPAAPGVQAGRMVSSLQLTLKPRKLSVTPRVLPYRLDDLGGSVTVRSDHVALERITARHADAELLIDGSGSISDHPAWDLQLSGRHLTASDDLRKALPPAMAKMIAASNLSGDLALDLHKLNWRPSDTGTATSNPTLIDGGDLEIGGTLWLTNASLDVGVPLSDVISKIDFATQVHDGHVGELRGTVFTDSMRVASRSAKNFRAELYKPADQDAMRIDKMGGELAGGDMAGQIDVTFPDSGQSRYALGLVLRNADVRELAGEKNQDLRGQLTASLALEGAWADPSTRRGRGDVSVSGKEMYKIPLVLGLLQITNLSLPISSPFNEANARYSVDGQKVTFESIEMRASNMIMQGSGTMDFDTKKVHMSFVTDNPHWPKIPIVQGLIEGAKHEIFQIHVNGTVESPKVTGSVMNTFQTTVDEVLKAENMPAESDGGGGGGRR